MAAIILLPWRHEVLREKKSLRTKFYEVFLNKCRKEKIYMGIYVQQPKKITPKQSYFNIFKKRFFGGMGEEWVFWPKFEWGMDTNE